MSDQGTIGQNRFDSNLAYSKHSGLPEWSDALARVGDTCFICMTWIEDVAGVETPRVDDILRMAEMVLKAESEALDRNERKADRMDCEYYEGRE